MEGFGASHRGREAQGNPNGLGAVEGADGVQAPTRGPFQGPSTLDPELAYQSGLRKIRELLQGGDAQALQPLNHERIHREDGDGTGSQKGRKLPVRNQNRLSGAGSGRRHPGSEFSRSPSYPGSRYQGARKDLEKSLEGDPDLPGRGAVEALHSVHSQKDPPPTGGFHHGTQFQKGLHHLLLGRVVMGRIRLQEGEGWAK